MGRNARNFLAKHQGRGWLKLLGLRSQGVLHGLKLHGGATLKQCLPSGKLT